MLHMGSMAYRVEGTPRVGAAGPSSCSGEEVPVGGAWEGVEAACPGGAWVPGGAACTAAAETAPVVEAPAGSRRPQSSHLSMQKLGDAALGMRRREMQMRMHVAQADTRKSCCKFTSQCSSWAASKVYDAWMGCATQQVRSPA